jgi:hypothetical protein
MSKYAIRTIIVIIFLVSITFAYGIGHKHGRHAQLTMQQVLDIAKAQFTCKMEPR